MAEFLNPGGHMVSDAVIYRGPILETVITGIPDDHDKPVAGGAGAEMREILRQLDEVLSRKGATKRNVVSVRLYLQEVNRDIREVNEVYRAYFGDHAPMRFAVGVDLQAGMLVEAAFLAELPAP